MSRVIKYLVVMVWAACLSTVSIAADFKYFSIDLAEGWQVVQPEQQSKSGSYNVVFTNQTQDSAIIIKSTHFGKVLTGEQVVSEAQKTMNTLKRMNIVFAAADYDANQGLFVASAVRPSDNMPWRIVMTQENGVLYCIIFNGKDIDGASKILNSLKSKA